MKKNVLLIGNGPSAINKERGKEIDAFDGRVVRCNGYKIKGYEKYIGTRTDILILGMLNLKEVLQPQYDYILLYQAQLDGGAGLRKIKEESRHNKIIFFPIHEKDKFKELLQLSRHKEPSTGIIAIYWFMRPTINLYLYGFDFYTAGGEYYKPRIVKKKINCHDPKQEKIYVDWLYENNKIYWF